MGGTGCSLVHAQNNQIWKLTRKQGRTMTKGIRQKEFDKRNSTEGIRQILLNLKTSQRQPYTQTKKEKIQHCIYLRLISLLPVLQL